MDWVNTLRSTAEIVLVVIAGGFVLLWIKVRKQHMAEASANLDLKLKEKKATSEITIAEEQAMAGSTKDMMKWISGRLTSVERKLDIANSRLSDCEQDRATMRTERDYDHKRIDSLENRYKAAKDQLKESGIDHHSQNDETL